MKRISAILLAAVMLLTLSACGDKETADDPLKREDGTASSVQEANGSSTSDGYADEVDFGEILSGSGATDFVYGDMTPAQKQAFIDDAKEDGVDVSFGSDGSMTVKDTDGTEIVQNPDGTWVYKADEGVEGQLGGSWPDNEFTKMLPKPTLPVVAASTDDSSFAATFSGGSVEAVRSYAEKVKEAGFSVNPEVQDENYAGTVVYMFTAENSAGYIVTVTFIGGSFGVMIDKN